MDFKQNLPYFMYMAEAEGVDSMVNTRPAKLNAIGRELQDAGYSGQVVPQAVFLGLCEKHNLKDVGIKDVQYIEEKWL